jgi:hypothetical protein
MIALSCLRNQTVAVKSPQPARNACEARSYQHPNPSFEPNKSGRTPDDFAEDRSAVHAFDVSRGRAPQSESVRCSIGATSVGRRPS